LGLRHDFYGSKNIPGNYPPEFKQAGNRCRDRDPCSDACRHAGNLQSEIETFINEIRLLSGEAEIVTRNRLMDSITALVQREPVKSGSVEYTRHSKTGNIRNAGPVEC
jgi:hypothetical protein